MAKPEGYRKAIRLMQLADQFGIPVVSLVDTPGAFPGVEAEERGQAEAIARSTEECLALDVPMIAVIVGEGGSGGAVAIAAANRVLMFEHAVYSVISPEGCASILWRTADKAAEAAEAMKITAADLQGLGVVDRIVDRAARRRAARSRSRDRRAQGRARSRNWTAAAARTRRVARAAPRQVSRHRLSRSGTRLSHSPFKFAALSSGAKRKSGLADA